MKSYIEKIKEIQDELKWDPELFESEIQVDMDSDIVTLSGQVENEERKKAAERIVQNVEGIKSVINKLQISGLHQKKRHPTDVPSSNSGDPDNTLKLSGA